MRMISVIGLFILCLLMALMRGAAGQSQSSQPPQNEVFLVATDSLPLPSGLIRGLAWLSRDTIVVLTEIPDSLSRTGSRQVFMTYQDQLGSIYRREDFTGTLARGLAFDGEFLWSCGDEQAGGSLLYKIEPETCKVKEAFPTSGHRPCGVSWDGENIWVVDRDSGHLDRFDVEDGTITRSVFAPGFSPYGMAHVDRHSWISDTATGRLYRLSGARRRWTATVDTESFAYRGQDVVLASDGRSLWYALAESSYALRAHFP